MSLVLADTNSLTDPVQLPVYTILLVRKGTGSFLADFGRFAVKAPALLFATPIQTIQLKGRFRNLSILQFHGDYYCIEYHKKDVACNGILFNNIYTDPTISLDPTNLAFFTRIIDELDNELAAENPADTVITSFIQVLLAKATAIKTKSTGDSLPQRQKDGKMEMFRELIDQNFLSLRRPADYASLLHISPGTLTKRCKKYFMKTPSDLIHERIILEAKKRLHLTRKSIKEIAHSLKFDDEHYFSRFFKKMTKVSPQAFRTQTGISIVADLSASSRE